MILLALAPASAQVVYSGVNLVGKPVPANSIGVENSWFLDLTSGNVYGPKTLGAWPASAVASFPLIIGGNLTISGTMTAGHFATPFGTTTLSGTTVPAPLGLYQMNLAGTSTLSSSTSLGAFKMIKSSDNANLTTGSVWNEFLINANYGGANFDGGRIGVGVNMGLTTASTLSVAKNGIVGLGSFVYGRVNAGGSSSGYIGALWGENPWCRLESGATFYSACRGSEINGSIETGASAAQFEVFKVTLAAGHAVQGTFLDSGITFVASNLATVGVHNGVAIGTGAGQWPIDPNGYVFQAQNGIDYLTVPAAAAGGIDLRQVAFSGSGIVGGGFAFASPGFQVGQAGQVQTGYGLLDGTSGGLVISSTEQTLSGTPTLVSGGTGFGSSVLAADAYGNIVRVNASSGVVTSVVSVLTRGWTTSPPSNPVTFNAITGNDPSVGNIGTGLTLNESWAGAGNIALGSGSDTVTLPVVSTGTPAASLCLDAGGHIIKKTTSGACI